MKFLICWLLSIVLSSFTLLLFLLSFIYCMCIEFLDANTINSRERSIVERIYVNSLCDLSTPRGSNMIYPQWSSLVARDFHSACETKPNSIFMWHVWDSYVDCMLDCLTSLDDDTHRQRRPARVNTNSELLLWLSHFTSWKMIDGTRRDSAGHLISSASVCAVFSSSWKSQKSW